MPRKINSKKRKLVDDSTTDEEPPKLALIEKDETYNKMNNVNEGMLELIRKADKLDFDYYKDNFEMVNEFIGNVECFVMKFNANIRGKTFERLNSDIWVEIFNFIPLSELVHSIQLVSKTFRSYLKLVGPFSIRLIGSKRHNISETTARNMLGVNFSRNITSLCFQYFTGHSLAAIVNCGRMKNLQSLDLSYSEINEYAAKNFSQSKYLKSLTRLNLSNCKGYLATLLSGRGARNLRHLTMTSVHNYAYYFKKRPPNTAPTCVQLESLEIEYNATFDSLFNIKEFIQQNSSTLTEISYDGMSFGQNIFTIQFSKLRTVTLSFASIESLVIANLLFSGNCPHLTSLDLSHSSISHERRNLIVNPNQSLTNLKISSTTSFGWFLPHCLSLSELSLCWIRSESLLENLKGLHTLSVKELTLTVCNAESLYNLYFYEFLFSTSIFSSVTLLKCHFPMLNRYGSKVCTTFTNLRQVIPICMMECKDKIRLWEIFPTIEDSINKPENE